MLTVTALVAMAAHIEGKGCSTMNQTGLAQKFGSVVSHVRVGLNQKAINAVRIPAGDADLLLGCDLVVAAGDGRQALKVFIVDGLILLNSSSHVRDDRLRGDPPAHHRAVECRG